MDAQAAPALAPVEDFVGPTPLDKGTRRRLELAESALRTLGELGYARASLREIAANSEFSHGVVHYYFHDKIELITFCVRVYKTRCSHRYDDVVAASTTVEELRVGFVDTMSRTLVEDAALHRLWYDLRAQSMFEPQLREDVTRIDALLRQMTWRVLTRYAELAGGTPAVDEATAYAVLDGLFEHALVAAATDPAAARAQLAARVDAALPLLLAG